MTTEELESERTYRVEERSGILCGTDTPTPEQLAIARAEADKAVEELRKQHEP